MIKILSYTCKARFEIERFNAHSGQFMILTPYGHYNKRMFKSVDECEKMLKLYGLEYKLVDIQKIIDDPETYNPNRYRK